MGQRRELLGYISYESSKNACHLGVIWCRFFALCQEGFGVCGNDRDTPYKPPLKGGSVLPAKPCGNFDLKPV